MSAGEKVLKRGPDCTDGHVMVLLLQNSDHHAVSQATARETQNNSKSLYREGESLDSSKNEEAIYQVSGGFLFCCVGQEKDTSYRYEVLYQDPQQVSPTSAKESDDHLYYNFPLRPHPRHGHLKKVPVFASLTTLDSRSNTLTRKTVKLYPDYPVHIPTFTLKRGGKRSPASAASPLTAVDGVQKGKKCTNYFPSAF